MSRPRRRCENCAYRDVAMTQHIHVRCTLTDEWHAPIFRCSHYRRQNTAGKHRKEGDR